MTRATRTDGLLDLEHAQPTAEDPAYLSRQLVTCIGNKRALLGPIGEAVDLVKRRLGRRRLRIVDAFSGSGVVSRFLKAHASLLVSNDVEEFAAAVGRCFLRNRSTTDPAALRAAAEGLNCRVADTPMDRGFIEELYAPRDDERITREDRVFYTRENARRLDAYRRLLDLESAETRELLLGPLLSEASIHANTAGVFKGFYKNRSTGIGQFGGSGRDALDRITGRIELEPPLLSRFECDCEVYREDANELVRRLPAVDLAYLDPPYNQHPYGSNYFMLNLLVRYERPVQVSRVSGIPTDWRRSGYNVRGRAPGLLAKLLRDTDAPFLLVSFNNEGFIGLREMTSMLSALGRFELIETRYNAFRGSRSFAARPLHVTERLFLIERR